MALDQQELTMTHPILPDLLALTGAAVAPAEALLDRARAALRSEFLDGDRISGKKLEANQTAAHGLAWLAHNLLII